MKDLLNREHDVDKIAELPHRERMRMRDHRYYHGYMYPGNKIHNFLNSNIGVNWDIVYSKYIAAYGGANNNRAGMLFTLLDGHELGGKEVKRLIFQILKK